MFSPTTQLNVTGSKLWPGNTHMHTKNKFMLLQNKKNMTTDLQHSLTHRCENIPGKGSTIISLYSSTEGEMP